MDIDDGNHVDPDESSVRLRSVPAAVIAWLEADDLLADLDIDARHIGTGIERVARVIAARPRDPSSRAALRALATKLANVVVLYEAATAVTAALAETSAHGLLVDDAPLGVYLRGIHAWMLGSLRAMESVAMAIRAGAGVETRSDGRVHAGVAAGPGAEAQAGPAEAQALELARLEPSIREGIALLASVDGARTAAAELGSVTGRLFAAAATLRQSLS